MHPSDVASLLIVIGFVGAGLGTIPLDRWLERRRNERMRNQAHKIGFARRSAARWVRR